VQKINELKRLMPEPFREGRLLPAELSVPAELKYDCMINYLAGEFKIPPAEACKCSEYDFWMRYGFEKLEQLKQKYFAEQNEQV
jgi:hypothetical protein